MWQKLYNVLITTFTGALIAGALPLFLRLVVFTLLSGYFFKCAGKWDNWLSNLFNANTAMTQTATFSLFAASFQIANAWLPVKETLLAVTLLFTFRAIHAGLKIAERLWEAVPLN